MVQYFARTPCSEALSPIRAASKGALLRREGLYTSLITAWRKQRDTGALDVLAKRAGRQPADPLERENAKLRHRVDLSGPETRPIMLSRPFARRDRILRHACKRPEFVGTRCSSVSRAVPAGPYRHRPMSLLPAFARLVLARLRWVFVTGDERDAEILALRHQILVLQRSVARAAFTETDRTILAGITTDPTGDWTVQATRNFLMGIGREPGSSPTGEVHSGVSLDQRALVGVRD